MSHDAQGLPEEIFGRLARQHLEAAGIDPTEFEEGLQSMIEARIPILREHCGLQASEYSVLRSDQLKYMMRDICGASVGAIVLYCLTLTAQTRALQSQMLAVTDPAGPRWVNPFKQYH